MKSASSISVCAHVATPWMNSKRKVEMSLRSEGIKKQRYDGYPHRLYPPPSQMLSLQPLLGPAPIVRIVCCSADWRRIDSISCLHFLKLGSLTTKQDEKNKMSASHFGGRCQDFFSPKFSFSVLSDESDHCCNHSIIQFPEYFIWWVKCKWLKWEQKQAADPKTK